MIYDAAHSGTCSIAAGRWCHRRAGGLRVRSLYSAAPVARAIQFGPLRNFSFMQLHSQVSPRQRQFGRYRCLTLLLLCGAMASTGCVRRRLTILSNPPGAQVYVDNYRIGTTPCSTPFTYYGTREIRLVKDGYETKTVLQPIPPPWYQIPPFDFVSENLVPTELRDLHTVSYTLEPQVLVPIPQLLARAEQLRSSGSGRTADETGSPVPSQPQQIPAGGLELPPPITSPPPQPETLPLSPPNLGPSVGPNVGPNLGPNVGPAATPVPPIILPPTETPRQPWPRY